ncbi:PQQ-dependent sugar dehydrogenase [Halapricum hydrolyticum]|uniref:PQQ-dependent sugar dehydrogenase n=1 Tax=Halapricum hydrolyticum TaxID=2979991 RepID=A0AAE3LIZ4_9EURY|nr:PQQ-dependent sugar dehydrogenase [Halapricum hydrolyticum]MCU4717658.1 PQQ-dependent sugar dehydrogenase [Halapricum hydrolyticum]MCU4726813.1 PQQ-dependent sugar dehydrogenase [Halapricum hydrolyticum]
MDCQGYSRRQVLALAGAAGVAGCNAVGRFATPTTRPLTEQYDLTVSHGSPAPDSEWMAPTDAPPALGAEVLVANLEIPWDLSVTADGMTFVTERVGRLRAFDGDGTRVIAEPSDAIDAEAIEPGEDHDSWWVKGGEGGTLGVAAHPRYPDPPVVYVYYTAETDAGKRNRVVALDVSAEEPAETETVVVGDIPADGIHNGGRIAFGPEHYLWVTCGDAGEARTAQDPSTLSGTVLKLTPTGQPAPDNPDHGGDPRVHTYGHRNPQGIVWLPDGTTVVTEHGPDGRDELNRLEAGANYGWPDVRDRDAYLDAPEIHPPLANSGPRPSWAPTGAAFYTGSDVPGLTNRLLVGGLGSQRVLVATLTPPGETRPPVENGTRHDSDYTDDAYTVTMHPLLENELGRIRHLEQGPDGALYAITSNRDGRADGPFPKDGDDVLVRLG